MQALRLRARKLTSRNRSLPDDGIYIFDSCAVEWRRVSLADCFAIALALLENGTVLTSDHHELDPIAQADLCPIRFIR